MSISPNGGASTREEPGRDAVSAFLDLSRALVGIAVHSVNVAPVDVTVTQYRLLAVVDASGPSTVTDLSVRLGVVQSNATRQCDRLQRLDLLSRSRSPSDGRSVLVSLTKAGRDLVDFVTGVRTEQLGKVLDAMSDSQRRRALHGVSDFNRAAAGLGEHPWMSAAW